MSDYFEAEADNPVEVKGKERPLLPYRILKPRAVPTGDSRPLVGRAEEMQQFITLSETCLNWQRGRVIVVRGNPGSGKSRLAAEFLHVAREQGLNCHATAILDFGTRTGRDALRMLVQSLTGLVSDADEASRGDAISEVAAHGAEDARYAPFVYAMLDVEPPAKVRTLLSAIDTQARRKALLDTLCHLVGKLVSAASMLLLTWDIRWADPWMPAPLGALAAPPGDDHDYGVCRWLQRRGVAHRVAWPAGDEY